MAKPLLKTKLYVPPLRPSLVQRPRLIERVSGSIRSHRRLTLLSAPAGFGKTTLLAHWVRQAKQPVAWLSLDAGDNDPVRFWSYVILALQTVRSGTGQAALVSLQSPQPPPIESILTGLLNEIADADVEWVLVLDDYHAITESAISHSLVYLLEHLPPHVHLILATRADPPWPLARLRVRGEMTELRTQDLRFTPDEASTFMNAAMGLELSAQDIAALDARTEGWIAGLQLAALSMQGRDDTAGFVRAFSGSHRYILDYLVEEVLDRQPDEVAEFLIRTSILDRLSAALCDAVLDVEGLDSQAVLAHLEQSNLFLIPLDDERRWYRYHHLFADLLSSRLAQCDPAQVVVLHQRASEWYAEADMVAQAIGHALRAGDIDQTERLVKHNALAMIRHGELRVLTASLESLPDGLVRSRPWLAVGYAWALAYTDRFEAARALLCDVEATLAGRPQADAAEARHIEGQIAAIRSYVTSLEGKLQEAIDYAREALEHLPETDAAARTFVASDLASMLGRSGDPAASLPVLEEVVATSRAAGDLPTAIFALSRLAGVQSVRGQLGKLVETYQEAMRLTDEHAKKVGYRSPAAAQACRLAGGAMYHRNDLGAAERLTKESMDLDALPGRPVAVASGYISLSRIYQAMGASDAARDAMRKGRQVAERVSPWFESFGAAWEALLDLDQGNLAPAVRWTQECGLRYDDEVSLHTYVKHIILARILVAQGRDDLKHAGTGRRLEEATQLLDRLVALSESTESYRYLVESLVVRALAFQAQGRLGEAIADLGRALTLAEPEGFVRDFIDEGPPMAALLERAIAQGAASGYARCLLDQMARERAHAVPSRAATSSALLVDPLSDREVDVLRLLRTDLTSTEIAQHLYISKNTVRSHVAHIYDKLGVHSRAEAVQRAQELDLI